MHVLLVEDSADDIAAIRRLMAESPSPVTLTVLRDGAETATYLAGRRGAGPGEPPHLILLDMRLPGTPGIEILQWIKREPDLCDVPVVVLSASDRDDDVREAQELGAHSYIVKPMTPQSFTWIARSIASYRGRLTRLDRESS